MGVFRVKIETMATFTCTIFVLNWTELMIDESDCSVYVNAC